MGTHEDFRKEEDVSCKLKAVNRYGRPLMSFV